MFEDVKGKTCCQKAEHRIENSENVWKIMMPNLCERQMSSSGLSSMSFALPVEPLKRLFNGPGAGHTGTRQLTITASNLSFPGFKEEIKDIEQMIQEGVIETRIFKRQR